MEKFTYGVHIASSEFKYASTIDDKIIIRMGKMEFHACILDNGSYVYVIFTSTPSLIRPEEQTEVQERVGCQKIEKRLS